MKLHALVSRDIVRAVVDVDAREFIESTDFSVTCVANSLATIWFACERDPTAAYFYGGTRLIDHVSTDAMVMRTLLRLMTNESAIKNRLINFALRRGILDDLESELPEGFLNSRVGGARCLIRPRSREVAESLTNPDHHTHKQTTVTILKCIGEILNGQHQRIKLTPDFGRNAGLADVLHEYTPNVLGIRCEIGGCGGKSSYATTGVLAGVAQVTQAESRPAFVTCIGSAGAMGSGVLKHFLGQPVSDLAVCDLVYDGTPSTSLPEGCTHLKSGAGRFTTQCLSRGGLIVATTVGDELDASRWELIPRETILLLAHNLALPDGDPGVVLARRLANNGVVVIPGQILTLGGALTARLEWYWRQLPLAIMFDKSLAHRVVDRLVSYLVSAILSFAKSSALTPYEAMLALSSSAVSAGAAEGQWPLVEGERAS